MKKMTSAFANKMIRQLEEEKEYWRNKEQNAYVYTASANEEPLVPDYDYLKVAGILTEIDEKICCIKHAINLANVMNLVEVGDKKMSIDTILVRMAQLNKRKYMLDTMRKQEPKTRINTLTYANRNAVPEYQYINYDLDMVKADYNKINDEIMIMQMALDKYNQTVEFEVDID